MLLLSQGWTASATAEALEREPHTLALRQAQVGRRLRRGRAQSPDIRTDRWFPPTLARGAAGGVERGGATTARYIGHRTGQLVPSTGSGRRRLGVGLSRSSCLNYLHRLGFTFKRPKKRLVKMNEAKRETFVAEYAAQKEDAQRTGAKVFFADEAHFRADTELRGKWVLKGEPALVDSTSPRYGEKASYYLTVCRDGRRARWNGWTWMGTATAKRRPRSWGGCVRVTAGG